MIMLNNKQVVVIGFGRQGQALARWLPGQGAKVIITDKRSRAELGINPADYPGVKFVLGDHPVSLLNDADLLCVSGGVPLQLPLVQLALAKRLPVTNDAQLFLERCPAPVIGITGSAGKTTTTTLTGAMLRAGGYTTWVGGNTGDVLLDVLPQIKAEDAVVMELSSFQLELMTASPQVGGVLNITPNHIDRHGTMAAYIAAKANIIRYQTASDIAVLCEDDAASRSLEPLVMGELVWFSARTLVASGAFLAGDRVVLGGAASYDHVPHILLEKAAIPLRGDHNVLNVLAACALAGSLGLATDRPGILPEVLADTIRHFKPVAHRLEQVRVVNGVQYINDSIATAPERLMAALRSFSEPLVVLIGGADKDLPWDEAAALALQKARHIIVFGKDGEKQVSSKVLPLLRLRGAREDVLSRVPTLAEAVQRAAAVAQPGDVVLLSPGGTSYDAYPDFAARGEHFRQLVSQL
ncbi:MAG: UDP-N-acetylmuramoyl-L-alanine--D-glutamate ligase [Anaerolineae bacterium]|jgi:UDP-N-acetylmuramoylalanine--D-glutamate ligase|nr:UDP-N-acetylmuramoyl-L-alanine--D-glutamate ligase [Anaerolineae bacterium]